MYIICMVLFVSMKIIGTQAASCDHVVLQLVCLPETQQKPSGQHSLTTTEYNKWTTTTTFTTRTTTTKTKILTIFTTTATTKEP